MTRVQNKRFSGCLHQHPPSFFRFYGQVVFKINEQNPVHKMSSRIEIEDASFVISLTQNTYQSVLIHCMTFEKKGVRLKQGCRHLKWICS